MRISDWSSDVCSSDLIQQYEHLVATTARTQGFDGHICGHIHFGGIRKIDGVLYCNDGDWVEHCTALTEDDNGYLELMQDRKSVVKGKSVSVRVDLGGRRIIKKKKQEKHQKNKH